MLSLVVASDRAEERRQVVAGAPGWPGLGASQVSLRGDEWTDACSRRLLPAEWLRRRQPGHHLIAERQNPSHRHAKEVREMSSSLSPACNADKHAFDTCFNHWFKSYLLLVSPPLQHPSNTTAGLDERKKRDWMIAEKKEEYERECGAFYKSYLACLKPAIAGTEGLPELLASARREEPLDSWGGIKVVTEDDLAP